MSAMISMDTTGLGAGQAVPQSKAAPPEAQVKTVLPAQPDQAARVAQVAKADTLIVASGDGNIESHFSVDPDTHQTVVRVVDAATQEVIRELPPETIRSLSKSLGQFIGKQMDAKA